MKLTIVFLMSLTLLLSQSKGRSPQSCSKPTGYVSMEYNLSNVEVNEKIDVAITVQSDLDSKILDYSIVLDDGLEKIELSEERVESPQYDRLNIKLETIANEEGSFYITIYTQSYSIHNPRDIRYKSLIVPVQIGTQEAIKINRSMGSSKENLKIYKGMESVQ